MGRSCRGIHEIEAAQELGGQTPVKSRPLEQIGKAMPDEHLENFGQTYGIDGLLSQSGVVHRHPFQRPVVAPPVADRD